MTASSIGASSSGKYAHYLDSRTVAPDRGDYYLGADGAPAEAPGRWLASPAALGRVGVQRNETVRAEDLRALMEGRRPDSGEWLRPAGPDGTRAGGTDVTFSPPKSVSVVWALGDASTRAAIEAVHHRAVAAALDYLRATVPTTVDASGPAVARELHAAEFLHTTARGVADQAPDPQLHSHVVITSVERSDGAVAAVRSRPVLRAAREVGAYYRAQLAHELRGLGYGIDQAGKEERYFRVHGVDERIEQAFSRRSDEVHRAAAEFRARTGREPQRGELRALAVRTRAAKLPQTRAGLDRAWREEARAHGLEGVLPGPDDAGRHPWAGRVVERVTERRAIFDDRELRTVALEQAPGADLAPQQALSARQDLIERGTVLALAGGRLTTARMRALERDVEQRFARMGRDSAPMVGPVEREAAIATVEERLSAPLTTEQRSAVVTLTGRERASVLIGQAGTGKGVVIDAAARAELAAGREVHGVAVAGRTAQQLGEASPALAGRVRTLDSLAAAVEHGEITIDERTTVFLDEAGVGDTERLARLVRPIEERGGSIVAIGDGRQLPSVGAGGMFERLADAVPSSELTEVQRTTDPAEQMAWQALRDGDPAAAMAHYRARGKLSFADTRADAVDRAARRYAHLARELGRDRVALMSDASNAEVDALNLRVQALRERDGELGGESVEQPGTGHRLHRGDRVTWTETMPVPSERRRVENGARGQVIALDDAAGLRVALDGSGREVTVALGELDKLRLGYADHVYRHQGATVHRAVAVTGGWQTSREGAYVEASRAREGVEWHVARDELSGDDDAARVDQLAAQMRVSRADEPSSRSRSPTPVGPPATRRERRTSGRSRPVRPRQRRKSESESRWAADGALGSTACHRARRGQPHRGRVRRAARAGSALARAGRPGGRAFDPCRVGAGRRRRRRRAGATRRERQGPARRIRAGLASAEPVRAGDRRPARSLPTRAAPRSRGPGAGSLRGGAARGAERVAGSARRRHPRRPADGVRAGRGAALAQPLARGARPAAPVRAGNDPGDDLDPGARPPQSGATVCDSCTQCI
jgi:conjugative relaxase-like TrwC/TraI family protein